MLNTAKYVKVKFEIQGVDQTNDDGISRQNILANASRRNAVQFNFNRVGKADENQHQIIEAVVDGKKIGEISDDDYIRYQTNIKIARDVRVQIYQEEMDDGDIYYTADAVIIIPYSHSEESRMKFARRRKITLIVMGAIIIILSVIQLFQANIGVGIFGLTMGGLMEYWGIFRKPEKDDKVLYYLRTGKRMNKIGR